jgi:nicotinamidase-related amidase
LVLKEGAFMPKYAVLVVDMLNDFVTGNLACERAQRIIAPLQQLTAAARQSGVPVIYCNDAHHADIDHELKLWGEHAMAGSAGAEIIPELTPAPQDYVVPKRRYSGFFQTDLHLLLRELQVDALVLTGMHTHMCVRHTAADGYQWGFAIIAPEDGLDAFTAKDHEAGLDYLETVYDAQLMTCDEIAKKWS